MVAMLTAILCSTYMIIRGGQSDFTMSIPYQLAKMTWEEVEERLQECKSVIVPVGSNEQHGPALPVDNDSYIATRFGELVCEALWPDPKVSLAPTLAYGYSPHHMEFKGTITLSESTLSNIYVDICVSLSEHGFENIILLNGHGGNTTAISVALHELRDLIDSNVFALNWWSMIMDKVPEIFTPPVFHACDMETSVSWALGQRVLDEKRVDEPGKTPYPEYVEANMLAKPPQIATNLTMKDFTESGTVGYSTKATKEKGQKAVDLVIERICDFIRSLN